ncbi:MAG: tetratricopeptide repeat protein [Phycisphaeraceae bacterium]
MDSERKHELQTNDLKEFLDNFKDFWDKYGNQLLLVLIVGLGGWLGYSKYQEYKAGQIEEAFAEMNTADSAEALRVVAADHQAVRDEALRRAADAALGAARTAFINDDEDAKADALATAFDSYQTLAKSAATTEYKLVGQEGLAKVAVMRENWDEAETHYQQIIELAGDTFLIQADRAQRSMDRLDLLKNPIAFAEPEETLDDATPADTAPILDPADDRIPALPPLPAIPPVDADPAE